MLPMRPELLKGHLDALLLAVLEDQPRLDLPTGTVYPALHRLERAGLIRSDWETVSGRKRRAYQLTASGRQALADQRAVWDQFSTAVTALLTRRPWPATT